MTHDTISPASTTQSPPEKLVYTAKEVEPILRLSKNTVNTLLRSGQLRSVRVGRKYLIPADAIAEFLK